jgi:putative ABC transport system substrate-binding protein
MARIRRLAALGSTLAVLAAAAAAAQPAGKVARVGVLEPGSPAAFAVRFEAFRLGLRELGYVEGRNLHVERRFAEGRPERLPGLAKELAAQSLDVIVTATTPGARAAQGATRTIPIVMAMIADPVEAGLVASLSRPGGNITGLSNLAPLVDGKRLELLKEAVPRARSVGFVLDPANRGLTIRFREMRAAAQGLGMALTEVPVRAAGELEGAMEAAAREGAGAFFVPTPTFIAHGKRVRDLAARRRLPVFHDTREPVEEGGGLMAYGPSHADLYRRAATYVDKILRGAAPAELPIEQPTTFELVVNLKAARELGLAIPPALLSRADHLVK